jgi:hypothetical protein
LWSSWRPRRRPHAGRRVQAILVLQQQKDISDQISAALDAYRDARDWMEEEFFFAIYGSPAVQGMLGFNFGERARDHPRATPEP